MLATLIPRIRIWLLENLGTGESIQRRILLKAFQERWERGTNTGTWRTDIVALKELSTITRLSESRIANLFEELVSEGYLHPPVRSFGRDRFGRAFGGITDSGLREIGVDVPRTRRRAMLNALRERWKRGVESGTWRTVEQIHPNRLGAIVGSSPREATDLFGRLVDEGYLRSGQSCSRFLAFAGITDKGLREIGVNPAPERERVMLKVLRERHRSDAQRGVWRTTLDIYELAGIVGSSPADAEELFGILIDEKCVRGDFLYPSLPAMLAEERTRADGSDRNGASTDDRLIVWFDSLTNEGLSRLGARSADRVGPLGVAREPSEDKEKDSPHIRPSPPAPDRPSPPAPDRPSPPVPERQAREISLSERPVVSERPERRRAETALVEAQNEPEGAQAGEYKITDVTGFIFGYIGILITLSFPIGVIALWLQLKRIYHYSFTTALYAASVTSKTLVIGKVVSILFYSTFSLVVVSLILAALHLHVQRRRGAVDPAAWKGYAKRIALYVVISVVISILCGLLLYRQVPLVDTARMDFRYLWWFGAFVVLGVAISSFFFRRARKEGSPHRWNFYSGIAILYLGSIAAAICMVGNEEFALTPVEVTFKGQVPTFESLKSASTVSLVSSTRGQNESITLLANAKKQTRDYRLLSASGSFWYVVDPCEDRDILAIREDTIDHARVMDDEEKFNCPPFVAANRDNNAVGTEGSLLKTSGAFFDPDTGDSLRLKADNGKRGDFHGNDDGSWTWSYDTTDDFPQATVTVTATDDQELTVSDNFTYRARNVAPTATFNHPSIADEGSDIALSLSEPSDPSSVDMRTLEYAFACSGDYGSFGQSNRAICSTSDEGTRRVKAKIMDDDGGVTERTGTVTINNVAPTASFNYPSVPIDTLSDGFRVSLSNPSDPGSGDMPFEYHFDCGSGDYGDWSSSSSAHCSVDGPATLDVAAQIRDDDGGVSKKYTGSVQVRKICTLPISRRSFAPSEVSG
jgi:hypothetical protein